MKYLENLIRDAEIALKTTPASEEVITDLCSINSLNITTGVYIIEEINGDKINTYNKFIAFKQKQLVAMPKLNLPSDVLYVGSSRKNLKNRLLQHAGLGYRKTYALHLKEWFTGQLKITVKDYNVSNPVLQLIEDATAFDLSPAFGKIGGNNLC